MPKYRKVTRYELAAGDTMLLSSGDTEEVISVDNDETGCWVAFKSGEEGYMNHDAFYVVED